MARLTAAEHKVLAGEWLEIWRKAGQPVIDPDAASFTTALNGREALSFGASGIVIEHSGGYAQQTYGVASLLRVSGGGWTITRLVCQLSRERLSRDELVAVRSGAGVRDDLRYLAFRMRKMHIEAALRCLDPTALCGLKGSDAREVRAKIEEKILGKEVATPAIGDQSKGGLRL